MARTVRQISVNLTAGTAKFMADMDAAGSKVREFGTHGVSSVQAASALIRTMEGDLTHNVRAVERFLSVTLHLGPVLKAAFVPVAAVAFGSLLESLGSKVYDFYKKVADAPERIAGSFRTLNESLRLTDDELQVANDHLENDIAKLEGRHENTLRLALDKARMAADKLADSLDKDLASLYKVLDQEKTGFWHDLATLKPETKDIAEEIGGETGFGGFHDVAAQKLKEGNDRIRAAKSVSDAKKVQDEVTAGLTKLYSDEIAKLGAMLDIAREKAKPQVTPVFNEFGRQTGEFKVPGIDERARIEMLQGTIRDLESQRSGIGLRVTNTTLSAKKESLEAAQENAKQDRPFEDRMKALDAQIAAAKTKLDALGKPEATQILAAAFGAAGKEIVEVGKALDKLHVPMEQWKADQIQAKELSLANTEAESQWRAKFVDSTASIDERIRSTELLTAAIGKGYGATRNANVESRLMQEAGWQHYSDPAWMAKNAGDVSALRTKFGQEFDTQHAQQSAQSLDKLQDQIELERALAQAQARGAEAVRQATQAVKLRQMAEAGATKEQLQAEMDLFNAQRANTSAEAIAKIDQKIAATQRLTAAIFGGAEAERQAALENKYAEMKSGGASDKEIQKQKLADAADQQQKLTVEASKTGMEYLNQVEHIDELIAALKETKVTDDNRLAIMISMRDLENQRLEALAQESLQLRGLKDGVRGFFIEMQEDAKSAATIVYETLNSSVDRVSGQFAKLFTGQKTSFGKMFQEVGESALQSTIKSGMQKGLGAIGHALHIGVGGATKLDGTTEDLAFWVRIAKGSSKAGGVKDLGGELGGLASKAGGWLGKLLHFGGFMAEGGDVSPGVAYMVGENGPEMFAPSAPGSIVPNHAFGNTYHFHNNVDARGADLGAANRIHAALAAVHHDAVAKAVQATHERAQRTPQKG